MKKENEKIKKIIKDKTHKFILTDYKYHGIYMEIDDPKKSTWRSYPVIIKSKESKNLINCKDVENYDIQNLVLETWEDTVFIGWTKSSLDGSINFLRLHKIYENISECFGIDIDFNEEIRLILNKTSKTELRINFSRALSKVLMYEDDRSKKTKSKDPIAEVVFDINNNYLKKYSLRPYFDPIIDLLIKTLNSSKINIKNLK